MDQRDFLLLFRQYLEKHMPGLVVLLPSSPNRTTALSNKDVGKVLSVLLHSLTEAVGGMEEVSLIPFGKFYPKVVQKDGQFVGVKMGLQTFAATNRRLESKFDFSSLFRDERSSNVRFYSAGGGFRVTDADGNELHNLSEIARFAGVSLPTAYKYARIYRDRIARIDNGTGKRYRRDVADQFRQFKHENTARPGGSQTSGFSGQNGEHFFTLSAVSRQAKVSIITLYKYLRKGLLPYLDEEGNARVDPGYTGQRRYTEQSIETARQVKIANEGQWGRKDLRE